MEKEEQASLMHDLRLGKGERHAHKTSQTLAQRVIPPLDIGGFSGLFAYCRMLFLRDHRLVRRPEIREAVTSPIFLWNGLPHLLTRLFASITHCIGDHLPPLSAESNPNPGVVGFFEHERLQFIQLQRRGRGILWVWGEQGRP
jgi:hypothetical protein